jgi:aerobic carbon-monoxide dehydrogenase medium subunit
MIPASFDYLAPESLDDAVRALTTHGEQAKLLAGGHSLLPLMKLRLANPKLLIDLGRVPGLSGIRQQGDQIVIGALTTHYQIESSELVKKKCPLLFQTARAIGDVQVRNRGTIGGSLVHADPSADWPAAILALAGELKISGPKGERRIAAEGFFLGPMTTAIEPTEILTEIHVPALSRGSGSAYLKMAQQASGFAIIGVAVWLRLGKNRLVEDMRVGITGFSDKPFRPHSLETHLRGKKLDSAIIEAAAAKVIEKADPLDDIHASASYRSHLARVYTAKAIQQAAQSVRK